MAITLLSECEIMKWYAKVKETGNSTNSTCGYSPAAHKESLACKIVNRDEDRETHIPWKSTEIGPVTNTTVVPKPVVYGSVAPAAKHQKHCLM